MASDKIEIILTDEELEALLGDVSPLLRERDCNDGTAEQTEI